MGSCLSSSLLAPAQQPPPESATVIAVNGDLKECFTPIKVFQVLNMFQPQTPTDATAVADDQKTTSASSTTRSGFSYVLCNSDSLCYDEYIPAMKDEDDLQPNQIYFLVPTSRLQYRLSATDMAAMAVKASVALQKKDGKRKRARISPVSDAYQDSNNFIREHETIKPTSRKPFDADKGGSAGGSPYARSGSIRRLQRYSSKRAKLAVRSFRRMLSTIYE
uniref:Uncharacterized protein n=1 Tax=Kalanchoe fedtschenkoi TaxID=63787 RepID=A0A7N0URI0_KALFE